MNFPTAIEYARAGHPVARSSWASGSETTNPTKWLTHHSGIWFVHDPTGTNLVTSEQVGGDAPNITAADILATDWVLPAGCVIDTPLPERPPLPINAVALDSPLFDVYNPPCKV